MTAGVFNDLHFEWYLKILSQLHQSLGNSN